MLTPVTDASKKNKKCCLTIFISAVKYFHANGAIIIVAVSQRKNESVIGGMSLMTPLAIIKFPDQIRVARTARPMPIRICR